MSVMTGILQQADAFDFLIELNSKNRIRKGVD